jgi:hypothetical protein
MLVLAVLIMSAVLALQILAAAVAAHHFKPLMLLVALVAQAS